MKRSSNQQFSPLPIKIKDTSKNDSQIEKTNNKRLIDTLEIEYESHNKRQKYIISSKPNKSAEG